MGTKLCYGHAMSVTSYGMIEMCRGSALWIPAAKPYFYGDVNTISLLAHPWGEWTPEDDLPAPVVEPRGLPENMSIEVRYLTHWTLEGEPGDRICTPEESKGMVESGGLFFDPTEWRCTTWLTMEEVAIACDLYPKTRKSLTLRSPELEACLAVMCAHSQRQETTTRLVLWFR